MTALLKRGTPVIIDDFDEPSARMVAVLTRYDDHAGIWRALYLSTYPHRLDCATSNVPTPITDFGMTLEVDAGVYRCVPTGEPCRATYRDGRPRQWQDRFGEDRWWEMRQRAFAELDLARVRRVDGRAA